jgi:hypothetical protein
VRSRCDHVLHNEKAGLLINRDLTGFDNDLTQPIVQLCLIPIPPDIANPIALTVQTSCAKNLESGSNRLRSVCH